MKDFLPQAEWTTPPRAAAFDDHILRIEAVQGSDFWQQTHYGFCRDSGHALLAPVGNEGAIEVTFNVSFGALYDQAGLLVRNGANEWVKAGVEISDGVPNAAVVITRGRSDWSLSPVPDWAGQDVTIRASWRNGGITIRAKSGTEPWRLLRLAPINIVATTKAGLYICSPERDGLTVAFSRVRFTSPDAALH